MTNSPAIYTAHDIPDLFNALPTFFGFRPKESLVAVATSGPRRRMGFRMRVDLPAPEHIGAVAQLVVAHLGHQGAEGAILLAVTERQEIARELLAQIEQRLAPIVVIVAARSDGERYWSDEPGFPADGIAYETSEHHLAVVKAIAAGQQILPDRQALVERFAAVKDPRRGWLEHTADEMLEQVSRIVARTPEHHLTSVAMEQVQPIIDRGLTGERLHDDELIRFSIWVANVDVRDDVWAQITPNTAEGLLRLLTTVARSVVPPFEPAVLSLAAFAAWLTGDGAQSLIAVERALEADADYSMATLMLNLLEGGVSPAHWSAFQAAKSARP